MVASSGLLGVRFKHIGTGADITAWVCRKPPLLCVLAMYGVRENKR